jgi:tRNA pseudouridine55 synthase
MQFRRVKRDISGVVLLDKPIWDSSNQALQRVKHLYLAAKAGHTGSLDPFATGLLPICFGEATKFSHFLLDADKHYQATLKLGITTTTCDIEGEVLTESQVRLTRAEVEQTVSRFLGKSKQCPPMYSALKHEGRPLYEYARAGITIDRPLRDINIYQLEINRLEGDLLEITVACSKGTYIRTLAEDIGSALGCGAHLQTLRRTQTGGFHLAAAHTLESLEQMTATERDAALMKPDSLVSHLPAITLDDDCTFYLGRGQSVWISNNQHVGEVRLYGPNATFLGLGEVQDDGKIAPKRLVVFKQ